MSRNAQAAVLLVHRLLKRPRQDRAVDMVRVGKRLAELNTQQARWPPACCVGRTCPEVRTDCWRSSMSMRVRRKHRLHPRLHDCLQPGTAVLHHGDNMHCSLMVCSARRRGHRSRC